MRRRGEERGGKVFPCGWGRRGGREEEGREGRGEVKTPRYVCRHQWITNPCGGGGGGEGREDTTRYVHADTSGPSSKCFLVEGGREGMRGGGRGGRAERRGRREGGGRGEGRRR